MKDDLFDHLKHKLSETAVPDPALGWQQMSALLDATVKPRNPLLLRRSWYIAAAASVLVAGSVWAIYYEARGYRSSDTTRTAVADRAGAGHDAPGAGQTAPDAPGAGQVRTSASGQSAPDASGSTAGTAAQTGAGAAAVSAQAGAPSSANDRLTAGHLTQGQSTPNQRAARLAGTANPLHSESAAAHSATDRLASSRLTTTPSMTTSSVTTSSAIPSSNDRSLTDNAETTEPKNNWSAKTVSNDALSDRPEAGPLSRSVSSGVSPIVAVRTVHRSRWGFEVGLGVNVPGSLRKVNVDNHTKWEPGIFPIVYADYRLTRRLTLKSGIAAPSPVAYTKTPVTTTLRMATDTAINQYGQTTTQQSKIGRLLYADVPVSLQWGILSCLSLEGGVQFSYLLSQQEDVSTQSTVPQGFTAYYAAPAMPAVQYHAPAVRKSDPRYLLGADFQWHRFSADLQYQGALLKSTSQFDEQGMSIDNHTSILRVQMTYRLR
jgi:hypothetical protein